MPKYIVEIISDVPEKVQVESDAELEKGEIAERANQIVARSFDVYNPAWSIGEIREGEIEDPSGHVSDKAIKR